MIEKLDTIKDIENIFDRNGLIISVPNGAITINKINEIIDFINYMMKPIQIKMTNDSFTEPVDKFAETSAKNVQDRMIGCTTLDIPESYKTDPYAEQRKWIGKLCRFWDDQDEGYAYAILTGIDDTAKYPYQTKEGFSCGCCEPVSEDLIYKGE